VDRFELRTDRLPSLKSDLEIVARQVRGAPLRRFLTYRGSEGKLFELGPREHLLCRLMDGETKVAEAARLYEEEFDEPLEMEDLDAFIRQLKGEGFLEGAPARAITIPEAFASGDFLPYGRVRLARGDRFVGWLARRLEWVFSFPAKLVMTGVVLLGVNTLIMEWPVFFEALRYRWGIVFILSFVLITAVFVQAPRHLLQAVACKRGGGYVSEIGLTFPYYVMPGFYCQYTDTRWIDDKASFMKTIAAGIYYQLLVWAIAMIGWFVCAPASLMRGVWLALAFGSGAGLLLIVVNPLMAADGYRLLSTWLEMPQLRERALAALGAWLRRRPQPEPLTRREKLGFVIFGLTVLIFTLGYLILIITLAGRGLMTAFQGTGAILTLALAVYLFSRPIRRLFSGMESIGRLRVRAGEVGRRMSGRFWALVTVALLLFLPYPYETGGPFTILPGPQAVVHCEVEGGRLAEVFVNEGDFVKAGQPLGQIDRREYEKNLEFTRASLEETTAKLDYLRKELAMLQNPPDIESILALEAEARRLRTLMSNFEKELELTTLRAPGDGRVVTAEIQHKVGRYLRKGDLFATVEQAETVRVEIQVPEADAPQVEVGARVKVVAWSFPSELHYGRVEEIAPIAASPPDPITLDPEYAVRVIAQLPNPDLRFKSHTTGFAKIKTEWIPVWFVASRLIVRWFQVQVWYWIP
jgi:putative peptide zinc metalloprotease protein